MKTRLEAVNAVTALNEVLPRTVPLHERISVIPLEKSFSGFIDPLSRKHLDATFDPSDPVTEINLRMMKELWEKGAGVGVWLSPGRENKILVATINKNQPVLYDMTDQTFSGNEFAGFMVSLSQFYRGGYYFLDELPWETLESVIPAPLVWQAIQNDQARIKFEKKVEEDIKYIDSRQVYKTKHGVDINDACQTAAIHKIVSPDGKIWVFAKNCGMCGKEINAWIKRGYKCKHCKEVYLGIC